MSTPPILSYADVLAETDVRRHLLLGNGFSIACRPDLFKYDKLFDRADFSQAERARQAFDALGTTNFEAVMRALRSFSVIATIYFPGDADAKNRAAEDANSLREVLVSAVAGSHPDRPHDIKREEYSICRKFLRGYKSINTLNYDLLLYWSLMQDELEDEPITSDDGFRKPADDPDADYVSWDPDNSKTQSVRYLHGALHLYDTGSEMKKFTWVNTQIPLIDQIRAALQQGFYPVFVSEGTSAEKVERIRHNDYLCKMYRSFTEIQGSLVVFGHSLDECDDHIFTDRIGRHGKTNRLYISLFGDPSSSANQEKISRASALSGLRKGKPLEVKFFDAGSASVWAPSRLANTGTSTASN
ncbi:DUF4917 family protein [Pedosphaera parvula]|uniref:DUF4917 domain-containing protein n=1 Tax=Pedosphaera parvula (strain Ellin514) TaxID=320771 RepID=B9XMD9_PEDPL|nr:DUF4917 family protein [Pedosphaera parvula]EEF58981.1 conserved hypothetical protein [Pedosphaera parvula Ellin514]